MAWRVQACRHVLQRGSPAPGLQGSDAARRQARGSGDEAQEAPLVAAVQLRDHLQEVADGCALRCVPACQSHPWGRPPPRKGILTQ